jgi:hypothetical protein
MPDPAQINRSLSTIRTELEFLQASSVLSGAQFQSIMAQLPVSSLPDGFLPLHQRLEIYQEIVFEEAVS